MSVSMNAESGQACALRWRVGKITDAELSDWTGMSLRNVRFLLEMPAIRADVYGGGKGKRRVGPKARNAIAIVQAMAEAGLTFEFAVQIISTWGFIPDGITQ